MIVPRFGADYYRPIAEGTGTVAVLNKGEIGHYPTSQMPGAVGNFAVAAHRTSYGKPFNQISSLQRRRPHLRRDAPTAGTRTSSATSSTCARPASASSRRSRRPTARRPTDRLMTMTSCNPLFSSAERIIAYSVFDRFYPRADGPPDEIAATVAGVA